MSRRVEWRRRAQADLTDVARRESRMASRIRDAVTRYAGTDYGDVTKLSGADRYRLRVGDWRVIFALQDGGRVMVIMRVLNRRDAYR